MTIACQHLHKTFLSLEVRCQFPLAGKQPIITLRSYPASQRVQSHISACTNNRHFHKYSLLFKERVGSASWDSVRSTNVDRTDETNDKPHYNRLKTCCNATGGNLNNG